MLADNDLISGSPTLGRGSRVLLRSFDDPVKALAFEEEIWRGRHGAFQAWTSAAGLVVPRSFERAPQYAAAAEVAALAGWPVVRRASGGDCVPQGPGVVNICSYGQSHDGPRSAYEHFAACIMDALRSAGIESALSTPPGAWCPGAYDISVNGRKLVGISQRRTITGDKALVHCAILVQPDLDTSFAIMADFIAAFDRSPPSRASAVSIAEILSEPVDRNWILGFLTDVSTRLRLPD